MWCAFSGYAGQPFPVLSPKLIASFLNQQPGKTAVPHDRQAGRQPRQPVLPAVLSFNRASRLIVSRRAPRARIPSRAIPTRAASGRLAGQVYEQQPQDIHCAACSASQTSRRPAITGRVNGKWLEPRWADPVHSRRSGMQGCSVQPERPSSINPDVDLVIGTSSRSSTRAGHRSAENGSQSSPPAPPQKASRSLSSVPTGAYTLPGCAT